ncbi:MAG: TVP38/TMEM64 family protein [Hyphomicrobiales bacterium]|nr:TVP38/TMEM64 family protein [Hyphomicrobiales bacterium]MCY4053047.1 TVP38/TMEM64 family protein [Hyphomicrobiales bacterium]
MTSSSRTDKPRFSVKRLLPLIILLAVMAVVIWQEWYLYISFSKIVEHEGALKQFVDDYLLLAILAYMSLYVVVVALSLPGGALLTITGGFLFGLVLGGFATVVAATIGASIIFLIAKTSLGEPLAARAGPWLEKLRQGFQENALSYLLFLRLVPAFPFWLVNLAPAVLGVKLRTYVLGTFFGIIPGSTAFTFLGVGLQSIIDEQRTVYENCLAATGESASGTVAGEAVCKFEFSPASLVTTEMLVAFTALGVVALIPIALRKLRARAG